MKRYSVMFAAILVLLLGVAPVFGQTVSDEAKRHFDRGVAAAEMAKEPADYELAIREFEQAARLAPDWPDLFYNLGLVQESAEKYADAIKSLRQYLQLAPNAIDAEEVKSRINKLEFKAEQVLTIPDIINVLVEFRRWKYTATQKTDGRECRMYYGELSFQRAGTDSVQAMRAMRYYLPERDMVQYQELEVTGPVLTYTITINVCTDRATDQQLGGCDSVFETEVEVVSRRLVKVHQRVLRGGSGNGTVTGDEYSCTFGREDAESPDTTGAIGNTQPSSTPRDEGSGSIDSLKAKVTEVKFFEGGENPPAKDQRSYGARFSRTATRYVYFELDLEHPKPATRQDFIVESRWFGPLGEEIFRGHLQTGISEDWTSSWHMYGYGWKETSSSTWAAGDYSVDLYVDGIKIASGSFSIY
jgi:hypothetical protein